MDTGFLIGFFWVFIGCIMAFKWEKSDTYCATELVWIASILFAPIVLLIAIVKQVIIKDWE